MTHFQVRRRFLVVLAAALVASHHAANAQTTPKSGATRPTTDKASVAPAKPTKQADKGVAKTAEKSSQPATPEKAAQVLDLRTIPLMEGAKVSSERTLGMLMYEAKGAPKAAFEFHRQQLLKKGFKELPGGYSAAANCSGHFTKEGFLVAVSTSEAIGEPKKPGWSSVTLGNNGNVAMDKLPVPPGVKPFYASPGQAAYTTTAPVAETAAACRKLLLAAGWEPYGKAGDDMQLFKRNAIQLQSWVSKIEAEGGKTLIRYDTELLQVDLPAPPDTANPDYTDFQKTLRFDSPQDQTDAILKFYQERLPKLGWKPTTEKPIVDDRTKSQFLIYRNAQKEMLSLDLARFTGIVRVELRHQTAAEVAEEERLAKEKAELEKQKLAKQNMKINVPVLLPAKAENLEQDAKNLFEFTLATGSGPAALGMFRDHFLKEGWTEEKGTKMDKNSGSLDVKKDNVRIHCSYFDTGITDAEIRVSAPKNVVLQPSPSKDKVAADAPADEPLKPVKKKPTVPSLPELPPGVEIPDDVKALLKKALEESGDEKPAPAKKPVPAKKPAPKKAEPEGDKEVKSTIPKSAAIPKVAMAKKPATQEGVSSKRKATEKLLGEYDLSKYNPKKPTLWISPDGRRVAYLTEKGIVIDGEAKEYDYGVAPESFAFSPDSRRTAYAAHVKRPKSDTNYILVLDGKEAEQSYHHIGPGPVFSPDSKHVVFFGDRYTGGDDDDFVVIDGKEGPPQKGFAWEMAFTPDSKRLVYGVNVAGRDRTIMREQTIDGSQKPVDRSYGPATLHHNFFYGPAGQLGYIGYGGENQFLVVYDGKEDPNRFREIEIRNVVVSGDGKHVAYVAEPGSFDDVAVIDGKPGKVYGGFEGDIIKGSLAISPDGSRHGYAVKKSREAYVVLDGKDGKPYAGVGRPVFSPDSKRVAYTAVVGDKLLAVIDGQEGAGYDGLGIPVFSPDSKSVAMGAKFGNREFILLNGQPQINGVDQKGYEQTGGPRFSPDGKRLVYLAKAGGKWRMVDSGKEQKPYDGIEDGFYFSVDGRHLATVVDDGKQEMVVVDGLEGNRYDMVVTLAGGEVRFDAAAESGSGGGFGFHYLAARGNQLLLVEETIQE